MVGEFLFLYHIPRISDLHRPPIFAVPTKTVPLPFLVKELNQSRLLESKCCNELPEATIESINHPFQFVDSCGVRCSSPRWVDSPWNGLCFSGHGMAPFLDLIHRHVSTPIMSLVYTIILYIQPYSTIISYLHIHTLLYIYISVYWWHSSRKKQLPNLRVAASFDSSSCNVSARFAASAWPTAASSFACVSWGIYGHHYGFARGVKHEKW